MNIDLIKNQKDKYAENLLLLKILHPERDRKQITPLRNCTIRHDWNELLDFSTLELEKDIC